MKRILLAAAAITAMAGAAQAQVAAVAQPKVERAITVNAAADAYCGINGAGTSVNLSQNLVNSNAMVVGGAVQDDIVSKLNALNLTAFCNGANNTVNLQRSALSLGGTNTSRDNLTSEGFAQAVIYDLGVAIAGAVRGDGATFANNVIEDTTDGQGGPFPVGRFGPTGTGAAVTFADAVSSGAYNTARATTRTTGGVFGPSSNYSSLNGTRLAAGSYSGEVRLELTPGV